jgi:hypothetical protein
MKELVAAGNALTHLMIQLLHPRLENSTIGYFDSYGFFNDMYQNPVRPLTLLVIRNQLSVCSGQVSQWHRSS